MSERSQNLIAIIITGTLCVAMLAIVGVACLRVAVDGDAPLTADITHSLLAVLPWLAGALVTAAFGRQIGSALISKWSA